MHDFPWLIVHGALVWKAALSLLVVAGAARGILGPARAARKNARAARGRLEPARDRIDPSDLGRHVTLTGKLEVRGDPCVRFEDGEEAAAASASVAGIGVHVRAEELRLEVQGVRVALDGAVEVLAGSRESLPRRPLRALSDGVQRRVTNAGGWVGYPQEIAFRSLHTGDRVIARGVLRRGEAEDEGGGYRVTARGWVLGPGPSPEEPDLPILLATARAPRVAWSPRRILAGAALGAVVFVGLFGPVAEIAGLCLEGRDDLRTELWAATPLRRRTAIANAAGALLEQGRFQRAADLAAIGGATTIEALGAFKASDFARSSRAFERARLGGEPDIATPAPGLALCAARAHMLAGDLPEAARQVRLAALGLGVSGVDTISLLCVADGLEAHAGDAGGRDRLRQRQGNWTTKCALVLADLLEGKERMELLERFNEDGFRLQGAPVDAIAGLLAAEVDPGGASFQALIRPPSPDWLLTRQSGGVDIRGMGLAGALLDRLAADPHPADAARRLRAILAVSRAVFDASTASWDESRQWAALARKDMAALPAVEHEEKDQERWEEWSRWAALPRMQHEEQDQIAALVEALPLRLPDNAAWPGAMRAPGRSSALQAMAVVISRHEPRMLADPALATLLDKSAKRQLELALQGAGRAIAEELKTNPPYGPAFRLLDPRGLVVGREELSTWLRSGLRERATRCELPGHVIDLGARLSLAEVVDAEMAGELQAALDPLRRGLLRRDISVLLAILEAIEIPEDSQP